MTGFFHRACVLLAVLLAPLVATAQGQAHSPYQGQESRGIKALSPEDVQGLNEGTGMGLAKAAELNRYPGPAHVLQLATSLELSGEQRAFVQAVFDRMQAQAVAVGQRILQLERGLDQAFAGRAITGDGLERQVAEIARLQGELRTIHLRAHLETLPLLSEHQVHQYVALRGYTDGAAGHAHGMAGMPQH